MKLLVVVGAVAIALAAGGVYHHASGARLETRMTPTSRLGYHLVIRNVGHRASYATCRASAFSSSGVKIFTHWIGPGIGGSYVDAGSTFTWDGELPAEWVTDSIARFNARCEPIDYHGNPPT